MFTPLCSVSGSSSRYCSTLCSKSPVDRKKRSWGDPCLPKPLSRGPCAPAFYFPSPRPLSLREMSPPGRGWALSCDTRTGPAGPDPARPVTDPEQRGVRAARAPRRPRCAPAGGRPCPSQPPAPGHAGTGPPCAAAQRDHRQPAPSARLRSAATAPARPERPGAAALRLPLPALARRGPGCKTPASSRRTRRCEPDRDLDPDPSPSPSPPPPAPALLPQAARRRHVRLPRPLARAQRRERVWVWVWGCGSGSERRPKRPEVVRTLSEDALGDGSYQGWAAPFAGSLPVSVLSDVKRSGVKVLLV